MALLVPRSDGRPHIDPTHLNPIVQVITWVLLAITTMALIFRLLTRCYLREKRDFAWEDGLILCSYIFTLLQSIMLLLPGSENLGNTAVGTSPSSLNVTLKIYYISNLFLILSLSFAKLSVCAGFFTLSPFYRKITYGIGASIILWTMTAFFTLAFQCSPPQPWNQFTTKCADRLAIRRFIIIASIITDICLVVFPITVVTSLHMPTHKRLAIMGLFFARTLTIGATVAQLIFVGRQMAENYTLAIFPYIISTQVVQCTSMSSACVVYIWPFLKALQSGLMWSDNTATNTHKPTPNSNNNKWFSSTLESGEQGREGKQNQPVAITMNNAVQSEPILHVHSVQLDQSGGVNRHQIPQ